MRTERKLVGYCLRCGGDCYDDGERNYHRCPPMRPEAASVIALKVACANFELLMDRRSWAKMIGRDDCADLREAARAMAEALSLAYPSAENPSQPEAER